MVAVHLVYDLVELYGIWDWQYSAVFSLLMDWGGVVFFLISGICATLGSRSVRRGLIVFGCGLIVSVVTYLADPEFGIAFGVLHCLGICMVLWAMFRHLPTAALGSVGLALILLGFWFENIRAGVPWLFPLGLTEAGFSSPDYFPLCPFLGFFLLGAVLGRLLYRERRSLLPQVNTQNPVIHFLLRCGRHSLLIYLLHQPVLILLIELFL